MFRRWAPLFGLLGTSLLALGACSSAFSFRADGWPWPPLQTVGAIIDRPTAALIIGTGLGLLILAWWWLRPTAGGPRPKRRVLVWWALPLLLVPPVMSGDPFLYADAGWIVRLGLNPYLVPLAGAGGPYAAGVDEFWAGYGVAYPPLSLLTNWLGIEIGFLHAYWGVIAQRLFAILGVALVAVFLPSLARRLGADPDWTIWFAVLNPYVVVHAIGGAHNDALMVGVTVVALWLASCGRRWQPIVAAMVVGVAMTLKQQAGLAVVGVAGLPVLVELARLPFGPRLWLLTRRTIGTTLAAVATFAAISMASGFGFGWTSWMSNMGRAFSMSPSYLLADLATQVVNVFGGDPAWCLPTFTVLGLIFWSLVLLWLGLRYAATPVAFVAWGSLAVALISNAVHPWYLLLGLVLVGAIRVSPRGARLAVALSMGFLVTVAGQYLFWWWWQVAAALGLVVAIAMWFGTRDLAVGADDG